ncbi:membrane-bound lytic murein transglycosylase C [Escherichia coli]|nr:membrane-bound lytic murein transglycosylase C [Escherichia coli]
MGDDPSSVDLYSDVDDITISKEPFLYGQVVDNTGQPIRWEGRASNFADYLLKKPSEEPQQRAAYHLQRHH